MNRNRQVDNRYGTIGSHQGGNDIYNAMPPAPPGMGSMPQHQQQQQQQQQFPSHMNTISGMPSAQQQQMQQMQAQQLQARAFPMGGNQMMMSSAPYNTGRSNISELVQVPEELSSFAAEPQFQQILLKVKEQTMINYITLNRLSNNEVESVAIDAPSKESAQLARNLIETHFKLQMKLKAAETRLQRVQTDLFSAQGEIASGMMVEFHVSPELIGLALGKKGARIKQVESDTKVSSINVNGDTGRIMIVGPDSVSVQRARELLELQEANLELKEHQVEWLSNKFNSGTLNDIKTVSDLIVARVSKENASLDIVGTMAAVRSAKFMISTQLEYVDKQIEIEKMERESRDRLYDMRRQYGLRSSERGGGPGGPGGPGDRSSGRSRGTGGGGGSGGGGSGGRSSGGGAGLAAAAAASANEVRKKAAGGTITNTAAGGRNGNGNGNSNAQAQTHAESGGNGTKPMLQVISETLESQRRKDAKQQKGKSAPGASSNVSAVTDAMKEVTLTNSANSVNSAPSKASKANTKATSKATTKPATEATTADTTTAAPNTSSRRRRGGAAGAGSEAATGPADKAPSSDVKSEQEPLPRKGGKSRGGGGVKAEAVAVKKIDYEYSADGKPVKVSKTAAVTKTAATTTTTANATPAANATAAASAGGGNGESTGNSNRRRGGGKGKGGSSGSNDANGIAGLTLKDALKRSGGNAGTK